MSNLITRALKSISTAFAARRSASDDDPHPAVSSATVLITHAEVCNRHGTGALLAKIFADDPGLVIFYSRDYFKENLIGIRTHHLEQPETDLGTAKIRVSKLLRNVSVRRIFCVPFYPDDVLTAIAAKELTGAPLVVYIMDDQNVFTSGIPDRWMNPLIERADLCFAISDVLQQGYQKKFNRPFWFLPPVASAQWFPPGVLASPQNSPACGVLIGNVWNLETLALLRATIRESGQPMHWFGNAGKPFIELDPFELSREGIALHPNLPDAELVPRLRTFDYGILPSGMLTGDSEHDWLFRASLPSRLIYMSCTAHLPILVLGDPDTTAGRFVAKLGLGTTCPYESHAFSMAVGRITDQKPCREIRERAAEIAPVFASESVADWIWRSLELKRPLDDRYESISKQLA